MFDRSVVCWKDFARFIRCIGRGLESRIAVSLILSTKSVRNSERFRETLQGAELQMLMTAVFNSREKARAKALISTAAHGMLLDNL